MKGLPPTAVRLPAALAVLALGAALALAACAGEPDEARAPVRPLILIGIDGAEWTVIERLWAAGELPALRALAERGTRAALATDYGSSPVIWTTIATGRRPAEHGIRDFVVPTAQGDVPVSSDTRRVPALWNMASAAGRRVAVVGWWASWPAEEVEGVVVSDRALQEDERRAWPPALEAAIDAAAAAEPAGWDLEQIAQRRDHVTARLARDLAAEGFDLTLVYFRGVDIESHNHWRWFEPDGFPPPGRPVSEAERRALAERIPAVYRATDRAIGEIVAAAPPDANVLVVSDHGFLAADEEEVQLMFDLDAVLERLGWLERTREGGVDLDRSRVHAHASPHHERDQRVRFGRAVPEARREEIKARLAEDLERVTWGGGEPVFRLRAARPPERRTGADLIVVVRRWGATPEVLIDGEPFAGAVLQLGRISGTHHRHTAGILIAAGTDLAPGAPVEGISILDLAPTVLYGLGLPVAEDFAGRPWTELYTADFRRRHPVGRIATWGTREPGEVTRSKADQELIDELGALGYLR